MSYTNRLFKNTLFNFSSSVWLILLHFFTTPYIVKHLGVEIYGIYSLLYLIIGYFSFLELGLGKAIIKFIAELHAQHDFMAIERMLGTSISVFCLMGLVGSILIAALNETVLLSVLKISPKLQQTAQTAFYMGAIGFLVSMPGQVIGSVPRGLQRFDITNIIEAIFGSLQTLLSVLLLYLGYFLHEIILLNIVISILSITTYSIVIKKLLPKVTLFPKFHFPTFRRIIGFSGYIALDNILITLSARINSFILGSYRSVSAVTYYTIPDSLSAKIAFIPRSISQTIFPSFSELQAQDNREKLIELYLRSTRYIVTLTIPFLFLFVIMADKFLFYWLGPDFSMKAQLPLQIMGSTYIISFWAYSSMEGTRALNRPNYSTRIQVLISFLNVALCFILIPSMGLLGAAISFCIPRLILVPSFIFVVCQKIFQLSFGRYLSFSILKPVLIALPVAVLVVVLKGNISSIFELLLLLTIVSMLYFVLAFFVILDNLDRRSLMNFAIMWYKK
jgi:O-antigen/teichoic acid export membrane protein